MENKQVVFKNTRLIYTYKDLSGRSKTQFVVLAGRMNQDDYNTIKSRLEDGAKMIPAQVGLAPLNGDSEDDHVWHRLDLSSIDYTNTFPSPEIKMNVHEFSEQFNEVKWDPVTESNKLFAKPEDIIRQSRRPMM